MMDARADLGDAVAIYLDGGPTDVGLESTVVALLDTETVILRQGALPREAIEKVVGPVRVGAHHDPRSPGTRHRHYSPRAKVHIIAGPADALTAKLRSQGHHVAHVAGSERGLAGPDTRSPGPSDDGEAWARALFAMLRDLDSQDYDDIVVEGIPEHGLGAAVMDRLRRAAQR
jgi:L-threonylcarbamoyladenylate synthase